MLLQLRFPTALARLLTSVQPLHLDVARYAFDETAAHLLNNRTKPVEGSNDRLGINFFSYHVQFPTCPHLASFRVTISPIL
ncbi:hypothetical protein [Prevotella sp. OH937_COT-195]|uniref:hypothetical protein n=1 Tax=Prevotella sp. OH937_COT-195 TaxID=2491051 RepID=UPI000F654566|nr:hypothetical protein [Prevotella sp. OH937_COT-195]RRD02743.1 hypothetical protein EII32_01660 [Prevotella sp. OH937_COT-195]